ncbi:MAG TPA: ABC transporter permease, partial [Acidimicrobiales bacterium]
YAPIAVNGHPVSALALRPERSAVDPSLISGRSPEQPDEITLGAKTLHAIHAKVGDTVAVRASDTTRQLRVVGKAVYPANGPSDIGGVGEGAGLTLEGLRTLVPDAPENVFPIVLARGVSRASALAHFNDELGQGQIGVQAPSPSTDVENYRSVRALPLALAGLLVAMALGALIHTLVSSVRRRRRDLAVLKTLGFVRRQVGATVAWQATVLALIALAAGVPLGLATGRWAWTLYAIQQGVIPEVHLPVLIVAAAFPLLIALANVAAALPARSAAATPPAALLRSE